MKNEKLPIFASFLCILNNSIEQLEAFIKNANIQLSKNTSDYELIIIDNTANDKNIDTFQKLTKKDGLPNIQVYVLTQKVSIDVAIWVGLENALGDFIAIVNPETDDITLLPEMFARAADGIDVVFAKNLTYPARNYVHRLAHTSFISLFRFLTGINLGKETQNFRVISRRTATFILQHPQQPTMAYRYLPATGKFSHSSIESHMDGKKSSSGLREDMERGIRLLFSTTHIPMRFVTFLTFFGAGINLLYSLYVVIIAMIKSDVAPGWVSLSLQQSGMFFLISLVLMVLSEYILHVVNLCNGTPLYHVGMEFSSEYMLHKERLNIEATSPQQKVQ